MKEFWLEAAWTEFLDFLIDFLLKMKQIWLEGAWVEFLDLLIDFLLKKKQIWYFEIAWPLFRCVIKLAFSGALKTLFWMSDRKLRRGTA